MSPVLRRYILYQLPEAAAAALVLALLVAYGVVPEKLAWLLFALWIAKEVAFYPLMRRAYEPSPTVHGTATLVGATGIVTAPLEETGFVRVGPELWRARAAADAAAAPVGALVRIDAVEGYTVLVSPVDAPARDGDGAR